MSFLWRRLLFVVLHLNSIWIMWIHFEFNLSRCSLFWFTTVVCHQVDNPVMIWGTSRVLVTISCLDIRFNILGDDSVWRCRTNVGIPIVKIQRSSSMTSNVLAIMNYDRLIATFQPIVLWLRLHAPMTSIIIGSSNGRRPFNAHTLPKPIMTNYRLTP